MAIRTENVCKSYNGARVLGGISLEIELGEFYVLMGPNGSGKSTLMSIIAGTNPMDSGDIEIFGHKLLKGSNGAKKLIGYVPQENFCSDFLTGRENLKYFAGMLGIDKENADRQIAELLEMMQLTHHAERRVSEYSGGMRKKLEVATSLLGNVEVLLLDEPSTGLDPSARKEFFTLLRDICAQGTTILLVTHIGEDAEIASRVGFMVDGVIVAEGTPQGLREMSGLKSTVLLDVTPRSDELLSLLAGFDDECGIVENSDGLKVLTDNPTELISLMTRRLLESGYRLNNVSTKPPSLEDAFYQLTEMAERGVVQ